MIKKLDIFVLKAFFQLFCGTFFISLFIFMMQFMWRYVEELVGKGLSVDVLALFFYYAALTLVPTALPLGVLLASLITFGNLAERLELLSMTAAGVPLIRILASVTVFVLVVCGVSFYFQNNASPEAQRQLAGLVYGMKQKNPELEIPEGSFYNDIPGYNLYVSHKNKVTGHLYNVMIYSTTDGYEDAQIILADSGKIQSTEDQRHLRLTLWGGERFRNMQNQGGMGRRANVPYMRETFVKEVDLIAFDNNFSALDADLFNGNAQVKNLVQLTVGIDSIEHLMDSVGHDVYRMQMMSEGMVRTVVRNPDTVAMERMVAEALPFDTIVGREEAREDGNLTEAVYKNALRHVDYCKSEYEFRGLVSEETAKLLRRHKMERYKKFTAALCCLLFFFIGAPLGAIIKKGGLGLPVVISVLIFIAYYCVNVSGEKMAKTGDWDVWFGMLLSSFVLAPIAIWLTYKANGDSALFNSDAYRLAFERMVLKLRAKGINIDPEKFYIIDRIKERFAKEN